MTQGSMNATLTEICHEMAMTSVMPDADMLDTYVKQYPQYRAELTDFVVALTLDALAPYDDAEDVNPEKVTPAVSRTMSFFQNALYESHEDGNVTPLETKQMAAHTQNVTNPIAGLSKIEFKGFVRRLDVNSVLAAKLRDRQIDPNTMRPAFMKVVAESIPEELDVVAAHLMAAPYQNPAVTQFHKADGKPGLGPQESFEDAVKNSGLTQDQQFRLMEY